MNSPPHISTSNVINYLMTCVIVLSLAAAKWRSGEYCDAFGGCAGGSPRLASPFRINNFKSSNPKMDASSHTLISFT